MKQKATFLFLIRIIHSLSKDGDSFQFWIFRIGVNIIILLCLCSFVLYVEKEE